MKIKNYHCGGNIPRYLFVFSFITLLAASVQAQLTSTVQVAPRNGQNNPSQLEPIDLEELVKSKNGSYVVTSEHVSSVSGTHHMYLRQAINGLEVYGTDSSIHFDRQGKSIVSHNKFVPQIETGLINSSASISAEQAVQSVAQQMGYEIDNLQALERRGGINQFTLFNKAGISGTEIPAKLMYYYRENAGTNLVWELSVQELNSSDWWNFRVDASSGEIIDKDNFTNSCLEEACKHFHHSEDADQTVHENIGHFEIENSAAAPEEEMAVSGSYLVYALPLESPYFGSRTTVSNPHTANASPFGWHDTNGVAGNEYTYTRGNNVRAYDDDNNTNGPSNQNDYAEGGASLNFSFSFDQTSGGLPVYTNTNQSEDAAVTNLFYWNNVIHDIMYEYGFTEAAGNFQENNYGNGGSESDSVNAEAQDGSGTCNANFGTPSDGGNPRMQMYVCNQNGGTSNDGDYDNLVIVHEYAHGISNRLTGGPGVASGLQNAEQMGEGWSDFYGYMLTMTPSNYNADRTVGTFLFEQGASGAGLRNAPYSTSMSTNPYTYADVANTGSVSQPHGIGFIWATMLYEMTQLLIDQYGFDPDLYNGTGGNNIALNLVTEAMKLQPTSPGFVDGRDAILLADQNIYGGANQCLIWEAFAKRGLGYSASQGSSNSRSDGVEAYDLPPNTASFNSDLNRLCISGGVQNGLGGGLPMGGTYSGPGVMDDGNGTTFTFDPSSAGIGDHVVTYTVNDGCTGLIVDLDDIISVEDDTLSLTCPTDITVNSQSDTVCEASAMYQYPGASGDCDRSIARISQNGDESITGAIDCTGDTSGHLRQFNLTTEGISRDYTLSGIDVAINDNAGAANIVVNLYLSSQLAGPVTDYTVPISNAITPYASATSLVPAGSTFIHTVPFDLYFPSGTEIIVEVISPATRDFMIGYNDSEIFNNPNESALAYTSCSGGLPYSDLSGFDLGANSLIIALQGDESNEFTTIQTEGLPPGSVFPGGTTTNTFLTTAESGGSSTCSFSVIVEGLPTSYNGSNWNNGIPAAGSHAVFNADYNTGSDNITACSCEITQSSTVTIGAGEYMNIQGNITVDGTLIIEHQGSVVQVDDNAVVNKGPGATINVELTTPVLQTGDFMILGSPMTSETRMEVFEPAYLVRYHEPLNFIPHPDVPPGGTNFQDNNADNWIRINDNSAINPGEGYLVWPQPSSNDPANTSYDMTFGQGTLNNGVVGHSIVYNGATSNPQGTLNVLANPYASAIDAKLLIDNNPLINEVYFWEHITPPSTSIPGPYGSNYSMDDISMYNGTMGVPATNGGTTPNGVISTGQGFGIKATGSGTVSFNNSMRLTTGNTTLRNSYNDTIETLTLKLSSPEYELNSYMGLGFRESGTEGMDPGMDSERLSTIISLYSHLLEGTQELGIQTREAFDPSMKIPVGFVSYVDDRTEYMISLANVEGENLGNTPIYLYDNQLQQVVDLTQQDYVFAEEMGTFNNRFTIRFEYEVLNNGQNSLEAITIYPNPTSGALNINSPLSPIEAISVSDLRGRLIKQDQYKDEQNIQVDISQLGSSVYFVTIRTADGSLTRRIIKN